MGRVEEGQTQVDGERARELEHRKVMSDTPKKVGEVDKKEKNQNLNPAPI